MLGDTTRSEKTLSWGVRSWCGDVTNEGGFPHLKLYERAPLQLTRPYNTRLWVGGPLCGTMPQAGFDPPSAEVQTSTECEFDTFTLQATTAGHQHQLLLILLGQISFSNLH